jgi:hypothetical protein
VAVLTTATADFLLDVVTPLTPSCYFAMAYALIRVSRHAA